MPQSIVFKLENTKAPIARKAAAIFKRVVREKIGVIVGSRITSQSLNIIGSIAPGIGKEGYRICDDSQGAIRIMGNDERGLLYGVGRFLREADFEKGRMIPGRWRGSDVPKGEVRGMYFATHFHNFYHEAPISAVQRYVEDLSLWGCNALLVWFDMHHFNGMEDSKAQAMVRRLRSILKAAESVGIAPGLTMLANEAYANSPKHLRADWTAGHDGYHSPPGGHYHVELCPNKPGGVEAIVNMRRGMLEAFKGIGIGYALVWPYDQGGCTCTACAPWGSNGYLKTAPAVAKVVKDVFPQARIVLSTWYFDHFTKGEWPGLDAAFKKQRPKWVDYLLVDDYGDNFPEYPLKNGVPGQFPMVNFTEISMYNLWPWGGFGANPLMNHFQKIWNVSGRYLSGGFPYSEGIFEDLNKAVMFGFFWDNDRKALDTVRSYVAGYFGQKCAVEIVQGLQLLEQNHDGRTPTYYLDGKPALPWEIPPEKRSKPFEIRYGYADAKIARQAAAILRKVDKKLLPSIRKSWRWRIILLRAMIDECMAANKGEWTPLVEKYFRELTVIYHAKKAELTVAAASREALSRAWYF